MIKVAFLFNTKNNDLFAYFPEDYYNENYNKKLKTSYSHTGQHSACHVNYARGAKRATQEQYLPLLNELKSIGYDSLKVLNAN